MPKSRFLIEIELELENLSSLVTEINKIVTHHNNIDPDVIVKTATASFLAQYYGGVENIFKRIFKMYKLPLPKSENWHIELFNNFCQPVYPQLPVLFEGELKTEMNELRKFRHRFHHGYSFTLDWSALLLGAKAVLHIHHLFVAKINLFIEQQ